MSPRNTFLQHWKQGLPLAPKWTFTAIKKLVYFLRGFCLFFLKAWARVGARKASPWKASRKVLGTGWSFKKYNNYQQLKHKKGKSPTDPVSDTSLWHFAVVRAVTLHHSNLPSTSGAGAEARPLRVVLERPQAGRGANLWPGQCQPPAGTALSQLCTGDVSNGHQSLDIIHNLNTLPRSNFSYPTVKDFILFSYTHYLPDKGYFYY